MAQAGSKTEMDADIVAAARAWIGTPYRHRASLRGVGADCLGLLRGVWRDVEGPEPVAVAAYTPDWQDTAGRDRLIPGLETYFAPIAAADVRPGDVVVFRIKDRSAPKHIGILARDPAGRDTFIHSYSRCGVVETPLSAPWRRRAAAYFRFPGRSR